MNTTRKTVPFNVAGSFAPSGFFKKLRTRANKPSQGVYRKPFETATPAQAARLIEVLGR